MKKNSIIIALIHIICGTAVCQAQTFEEVLNCGLPVVVINTVNGEEPTSTIIEHPSGCVGMSITDVVPKEGRIQVYRGDTLWYDSGDYKKDKSGMVIKHRGNTSAAKYPNKPFKITLQKKADLVMTPNDDDTDRRSKHWVLLNSTFSLVTLYAYWLETMMDMEFPTREEYVNVFVNGDYRGLYVLSENVRRASNRVDVDEDDGYIIELDAYHWKENLSVPSIFTRVLAWTFKYPETDDLTEEMEEGIRSDVDRLEKSASSHDYSKVIDIESVARWTLLQDILSTHDPAGTNLFVARTNRDSSSLMRMPVAWDLASSMEYIDAWSRTHVEPSIFIRKLFDNPFCQDFANQFLAEWKHVKQAKVMQRMAEACLALPSTDQGKGLKLSYPYHAKRWGTRVYDVDKMSEDGARWFTDREHHLDSLMQILQDETTSMSLPTENPDQTLEEALSYGLPVVVVNTVNGEEPTAERVFAPDGCLGESIRNATKVPGGVRIYYPGDSEHPVFDSGEYSEGESGMTIKIRGNSSAMRPKNPFKIKLQKKADLLMRGDKRFKDKEWALIRPTGGAKHPCPIPSMFGWQITKTLHVSDWVPASQYVNLIVNGDFRGFYQLTETVKRNEKCRINVDEQTGYIAEIDPYWWNGEVNFVESPVLKNTYRFTFKYPDSDDITQEQLDAFKELVELLNVSLESGTYPLYIDVENCARWLLAHQILGTLDAAGSNMFVIRRDSLSKLQMGTLWDFDSTFRIQGTFTPIMSQHYFKQMLQNSPNKQLAREMNRIWESEKERVMTEVYEFFDSIAGTDFALAIDNSTKANLKRWPGNVLDDMDTTVDKLRDWFTVRTEEVDSLLKTLNTEDGAIQWTNLPEGTFVLNGTEQPQAGSTLSLTSEKLDLSEFTFKWTRGDALGAFNDSDVLSDTNSYAVTDNDYEHWLRVTVCDKAENTVYTQDTWISKLPVLYIDTDDGKPVTSKENYVTANLRIQGNTDFEQQYLGATEIRGRGTTSWSQYPQKPYKLKLDKKTNLFGFGKSKHWVLISNFNDKSCLRNYTASRLAKQLGVLGMNMTWVDVVLNGEVKGCYMLSQHVRADKNSVDIFDWEDEAEDVADALFNAVKDADTLQEEDKELLEETMKANLSWVTDGNVTFNGKNYNLSDYSLKKEYDISQGYLFEATAKKDGLTQFTTPGNVHFEVCTPEYLSTNSRMLSYVTELWTTFEAEYSRIPTTGSTKNFSKYADMESMVAVWLVNEMMGQGDPTNSRYSYIAGDGKLRFGPVWDFDHAASCWSTDQNVHFFYTLIHNLPYIYYKKWFPDPGLCLMAYDAYWKVARPFVMDYISEGGELDAKYARIAEAGRTNDILWGSYPSILNPKAEPRTTEKDAEILRTFLLGHIQWLDQQFESVRTLVEAMNKVCSYPCDPDIIDGIATSVVSKQSERQTQTGIQKIIKNKHLYIIKNGETYSLDGYRVSK